MKKLSPKERVLKALHFEKPDRIPIDLGTTNCTTMTKIAHRNLCKKLGLEPSGDVFLMKNFQIVEINEKILEELEIDTRGVHGSAPGDVIKAEIDENTYISQFGIKYRRPGGGLYYDMVEYPLAGKSLEEYEDYKWPEPYYNKNLMDEVERKARKLYNEGKYAIVGDMIETGIFEPCWYLRGFSDFLMDLKINKDFVHRIMQDMLNYQIKRHEMFLDKVGRFLDVVFVGDDLATSESTIMSPEIYREMIKPYQKKYFKAIKSMTRAKLLYHTDGNVINFVEDLIEIGVDILNPIDVTALDVDKLKQEFGNRLCFWGGIDTKRVLPKGTPGEVENEVRKRIQQLGPEGYVLTSVHNVQADVPAKNFLIMLEAAKKTVL